MRSFADLDATLATVPSSVVSSLRIIDVGAGSELLHSHRLPGLLDELALRARVESVTASSAIEGVVVSDTARVRRILSDRPPVLRNRDEQQLAGYRTALDYLFSEPWEPLNVGLVLHLHRLLWSATATQGGQLKTEDNLVVDRLPDGMTTVRFRPVSAALTPGSLTELVDRYLAADAGRRHHPVLLTGLFVLDLLVIHPFSDGNGRVARVLANALLARDGYGVGRWVSLEQLIAARPEEYYAALLASTRGWHDQAADVWPWLAFFTSVLASAYEELGRRVSGETGRVMSKQQRVRRYVLEQAPEVFCTSDVRAALPGISDATIRLAMVALRDAGILVADGTGRSAAWHRASQPSGPDTRG